MFKSVPTQRLHLISFLLMAGGFLLMFIGGGGGMYLDSYAFAYSFHAVGLTALGFSQCGVRELYSREGTLEKDI